MRLPGSLSNIQAEVDLFIGTAKDNNLELFVDGQLPPSNTAQDDGLLGPYESATRSYVEFMITTAATGTIEEGLSLLWAMEKVRARSAAPLSGHGSWMSLYQ